MTRKIKILIRGLFIGVVLIGGWLVWSPQVYAETQEVTITTDKTEYEQGEIIKITVTNNLDKSIWYNMRTCPPFCYALQKLESGEWRNILIAIEVVFDLPVSPSSLKPNGELARNWDTSIMEDGSRKIAETGVYRFFFDYGLNRDSYTDKTIYSNEFVIKEKDAKEVIVTTGKTEYEQGETIGITLKNNLKESIFSHIGSGTPGFCIEYIERKTPTGNWEKLFTQCQYPHCIYDIDAPAEIKPGQSETFEWKPLIYINGTLKSIQAGPGIYRLIILYQIREGSSSENWEWKTTKSNEFTVK